MGLSSPKKKETLSNNKSQMYPNPALFQRLCRLLRAPDGDKPEVEGKKVPVLSREHIPLCPQAWWL